MAGEEDPISDGELVDLCDEALSMQDDPFYTFEDVADDHEQCAGGGSWFRQLMSSTDGGQHQAADGTIPETVFQSMPQDPGGIPSGPLGQVGQQQGRGAQQDAHGELPVASRTRARMDLGPYELDDIEALLDAPDADDELLSEPSDGQMDEYRNFLRGLENPSLTAGTEEPNDKEFVVPPSIFIPPTSPKRYPLRPRQQPHTGPFPHGQTMAHPPQVTAAYGALTPQSQVRPPDCSAPPGGPLLNQSPEGFRGDKLAAEVEAAAREIDQSLLPHSAAGPLGEAQQRDPTARVLVYDHVAPQALPPGAPPAGEQAAMHGGDAVFPGGLQRRTHGAEAPAERVPQTSNSLLPNSTGHLTTGVTQLEGQSPLQSAGGQRVGTQAPSRLDQATGLGLVPTYSRAGPQHSQKIKLNSGRVVDIIFNVSPAQLGHAGVGPSAGGVPLHARQAPDARQLLSQQDPPGQVQAAHMQQPQQQVRYHLNQPQQQPQQTEAAQEPQQQQLPPLRQSLSAQQLPVPALQRGHGAEPCHPQPSHPSRAPPKLCFRPSGEPTGASPAPQSRLPPVAQHQTGAAAGQIQPRNAEHPWEPARPRQVEDQRGAQSTGPATRLGNGGFADAGPHAPQHVADSAHQTAGTHVAGSIQVAAHGRKLEFKGGGDPSRELLHRLQGAGEMRELRQRARVGDGRLVGVKRGAPVAAQPAAKRIRVQPYVPQKGELKRERVPVKNTRKRPVQQQKRNTGTEDAEAAESSWPESPCATDTGGTPMLTRARLARSRAAHSTPRPRGQGDRTSAHANTAEDSQPADQDEPQGSQGDARSDGEVKGQGLEFPTADFSQDRPVGSAQHGVGCGAGGADGLSTDRVGGVLRKEQAKHVGGSAGFHQAPPEACVIPKDEPWSARQMLQQKQHDATVATVMAAAVATQQDHSRGAALPPRPPQVLEAAGTVAMDPLTTTAPENTPPGRGPVADVATQTCSLQPVAQLAPAEATQHPRARVSMGTQTDVACLLPNSCLVVPQLDVATGQISSLVDVHPAAMQNLGSTTTLYLPVMALRSADLACVPIEFHVPPAADAEGATVGHTDGAARVPPSAQEIKATPGGVPVAYQVLGEERAALAHSSGQASFDRQVDSSHSCRRPVI